MVKSPKLPKEKTFPQQKLRIAIITLACFLIPAPLINPFHHLISAQSKALLRGSRNGRTIVYWTPHKTGSTSMRIWLTAVSKEGDIPLRYKGYYYPYSKPTDWVRRVEKTAENVTNCGIIAGHIYIPPLKNRLHEGTLGSVITTTRDAKNTLASKYFHRTRRDLNDSLPGLKRSSSEESRLWFYFFHDHDPCEQLRYYDGLEGCENNENALVNRARRIAENIDCAVDTDDPNEDLKVICGRIGLKNCPKFPYAYRKSGKGYDELFEIEHLTRIMQPVLRVTNILRAELMKRRCRFLEDGSDVFIKGLGKAKWPSPGCRSDS